MAPMTFRTSIIIPALSDVSRHSLASLDQQTLPAGEFEILIGDDATDPEGSGRLADLIAHRTNVRRCAAASGGGLPAALAEASGEYLMVLTGDRRLAPEALERMCALADSTTSDTCLGLTGQAGTRPALIGSADAQDGAGAPGGEATLTSTWGRIHRRSAVAAVVADEAATRSVSAFETACISAASKISAVSTVPCFLDGTADPGRISVGAVATSATLPATAVTWDGGVVTLEVTVSAAAGASCGVSVYSPATGVEWQVADSDVNLDTSASTLSIRIDPERLAAGHPLSEGTWLPSVRIPASRTHAPSLIGASARVAAGGTHTSRYVVSFAAQNRLGLDVGGLRHQLVDRLLPKATAIVEDARGSLLTSAVSGVDLAPGVRLEGSLRVGGLPVHAWLTGGDDGGAVLTAWVSGLVGNYPLATRFTPAPYAATGTRLSIDRIGAMRVRLVPAEKPSATAPRQANPANPARRVLARSVRVGRRTAGQTLRRLKLR
jgi:hypothetical protein